MLLLSQTEQLRIFGTNFLVSLGRKAANVDATPAPRLPVVPCPLPMPETTPLLKKFP